MKKTASCLQVFSAQAEVFLLFMIRTFFRKRFLRASGGVSWAKAGLLPHSPFSPRKRRCFHAAPGLRSFLGVFSAQAEVFPPSLVAKLLICCFLRASGGVSFSNQLSFCQPWFSPRKRRCFRISLSSLCACFVFSAQAEVFPKPNEGKLLPVGFLRASGGVSAAGTSRFLHRGFSPRKRRCF